MKRGDIIKAVLTREYGKPRPAVVVQTDRLAGSESIILCPLTSDLLNAEPIRITIDPTVGNGLTAPSQIMVDKITALPRAKCREVIGRLDADTREKLDAALALVIGLLD